MITRRGFIGSIAAATTAVAGPRPGSSSHEPDHIVAIALNQDATTLDARKVSPNRGSRKVLENIHERLVRRDASLNVVPALAEHFEARRGSGNRGPHVEFRLRNNVKFHPPVDRLPTSLDVEFSISLVRSSLSALRSIETPDPTTVRLYTESPTLLLSELADHVVVLPKDYDDQEKRPVGAGAYRYDSRTPSVVMMLRRSDTHYERPYVPGLKFVVVPEKATQTVMLATGEIDITDDPSTKAFVEEIRLRKMSPESTPAGLVLLGMRTTSAPLTDARLRRAVSHAIDRTKLPGRVPDLTTPLGTIVPPEATASPGVEWPGFNLARARQLVQEVAGNAPVRMTITTVGPLADIGRAVADDLKQVNILAEVKTVETPVFFSAISEGKLEAYLFRLTPSIWDTHTIIASYFRERGAFTTYPRSQIETMLQTATRQAATADRAATYAQIMRRLIEDPPVVPLLRDIAAYGVNPARVRWKPRPDGHVLGREMSRLR